MAGAKLVAADQCVLELSDELPAICVDGSQIEAAFDELVRNATEAAVEGQRFVWS